MSEVFNIPLEWLATESGPFEGGPEMEDFVAKAFHASSSEEVEHAHLVRRAFQEGAGAEWEETPEGEKRLMPVLPLHRGGSALVLLVGLWRRRMRSKDAVTPEEEIELAWELGRAVMAPLEALGVRRGGLYQFFLYEHIEAMTPVLRRAIEYEDSLQQEEQESR